MAELLVEASNLVKIYKAADLAIEAFETRVLVGRDPANPEKLKSAPFPAEMVTKFTGS